MPASRTGALRSNTSTEKDGPLAGSASLSAPNEPPRHRLHQSRRLPRRARSFRYCLGAWSARTLVAEVALPTLFRRLPGLVLSQDSPVTWGGWVFRGTLT